MHIKRDGGLLCGLKQTRDNLKGGVTTFSDAHKYSIEEMRVHFCKDCVIAYYNILEKLPYLIVNGKPQQH